MQQQHNGLVLSIDVTAFCVIGSGADGYGLDTGAGTVSACGWRLPTRRLFYNLGGTQSVWQQHGTYFL